MLVSGFCLRPSHRLQFCASVRLLFVSRPLITLQTPRRSHHLQSPELLYWTRPPPPPFKTLCSTSRYLLAPEVDIQQNFGLYLDAVCVCVYVNECVCGLKAACQHPVGCSVRADVESGICNVIQSCQHL
jgi:hypothetical protein